MDKLLKSYRLYRHRNGRWSLASEFKLMRLVTILQSHVNQSLQHSVDHLINRPGVTKPFHRRQSKNIILSNITSSEQLLDTARSQWDTQKFVSLLHLAITRFALNELKSALNRRTTKKIVQRSITQATEESPYYNFKTTQSDRRVSNLRLNDLQILTNNERKISQCSSVEMHCSSPVSRVCSFYEILQDISGGEEIEVRKTLTMKNVNIRRDIMFKAKEPSRGPSLNELTEKEKKYMNSSRSLSQFPQFVEEYKGNLWLTQKSHVGRNSLVEQVRLVTNDMMYPSVVEKRNSVVRLFAIHHHNNRSEQRSIQKSYSLSPFSYRKAFWVTPFLTGVVIFIMLIFFFLMEV